MSVRGWSPWGLGGTTVATVVAAVTSNPARPGHDGVQSCAGCHAFERSLTHAVDVYPSGPTPGHLPLQNGRLTCVTCHDVVAGRGPWLLRTGPAETEADLCRHCHEPDGRGRVADFHATGGVAAHLGTRGHGPEPRGVTGLDLESESCLSCHDGAIAPGDPARFGRTGSLASRMFGGQHPIGVEQRPRGVGDTLASPNAIHPVVRLFDGRVGCGSCHSPYARNESLLVMSMERSSLCLECHGL